MPNNDKIETVQITVSVSKEVYAFLMYLQNNVGMSVHSLVRQAFVLLAREYKDAYHYASLYSGDASKTKKDKPINKLKTSSKTEVKKDGTLKREGLTYRCWQVMMRRCYNPNDTHYRFYGGRGITVCERWHNFDKFFEDMGEKPYRYGLMRKDKTKGYSSENCHYAPIYSLSVNWVDSTGKEVYLPEVAKQYGMNYSTLWGRLSRGMTIEEAVTKPVEKSRKGIPHKNKKKVKDTDA